MKIKADPTVVLKAFKISSGTISELHKLKIKTVITEAGATFSIPSMGATTPYQKVAIPPSVLQLAIDGKLQPMSLQNISGNLAQSINKMIAVGLENAVTDKVAGMVAQGLKAELAEAGLATSYKLSEKLEDPILHPEVEVEATSKFSDSEKKDKAAAKYPLMREMTELPELYTTVSGVGTGAYTVVAVGDHGGLAMRYYGKKLQVICEYFYFSEVNNPDNPLLFYTLSDEAVKAAISANMTLKYNQQKLPYRSYLSLSCPSKLLAAKAIGAIMQEHLFHGCQFTSGIPDPRKYLTMTAISATDPTSK